MVRAYHANFAAYGFWLPNDPRGSWSDFVRSWELLRHGRATRVTTHRSVAHIAHDAESRHRAKQSLRYPPVRFDGVQARACARGFAESIRKSEYRIFACAILPDHVHMIVARHLTQKIEQIIGQLKAAASRRLNAEGIHPLRQYRDRRGGVPSPWVRKGWNVYLNTDDEIHRAIHHVNENPMKAGLRRQSWKFVESA